MDILDRGRHLFKAAKIVKRTYRDWIRVGIKLKAYGFPFMATDRRGIKVNIEGYGDVISNYLLVRYNILFHYNKEFSDPFAVFLYNEYRFLSRCKDLKVLDMGANIGDSSIYFVVNGAIMVIAVEPYPSNFSVLNENIEKNNLQNRIIAINAVGGCKNDYIKIDVDREVSTGSDVVESPDGYNIEEITLDSLVLRYDLADAYLKMDCEGCEYKAIMASSKDTLRKFSKMQIEYHYGYNDLVDKLRSCGFKVRYTRARSDYNICASNPNMSVGYIYASRI